MASKPAVAKAGASKAVKKPAVAAAKPKVTKLQAVPTAEMAEEVETGARLVAQLRVKELVDRVVTATDQSRKDVKAVVEATLAELAKALNSGESLNLPPLGRIRVANQRSDEAGLAMTLKLRKNAESGKAGKGAKQPLAELGEAG